MRQIMDAQGETGKQMGLDFHNHNDRGLGSANALAAISGGADRIHGVLVGIGERTGNAPLETVMYNVDRLLKDAGYKDSRWNLKSVFELALHYSRITGVLIPAHAPLVGENAFRTQAGIHSDAEEKALMAIQEHAAGKSGATKDSIALALDTIAATIYSSVDPRDIGREHDEEIGPMAGGSTVRLWLWHHGYNVKLGGVFWTKFEHSLSKTPTKEASPAVARSARPTTEKYSLLFSFCARRFSFSPNEKSIFLWCPADSSRTAGLSTF